MKTAISIPDDIFDAAEKAARRMGISRSELYQRAVVAFLRRRGSDVVRERLDRVYGKESNRALDPLIRAAGEKTLVDEDW
ncbi:MAG TPA: CopG family transcriptional regulator [Candidatus Krumholzibacteria bacterium]|nr:CopG family transcriptional regulator [Candidatus Krumholzibacteria bacterium]